MFPCLKEWVAKNKPSKMYGQNESSKMGDKNDQLQMHFDQSWFQWRVSARIELF